jgi:hypothetical protein
LHTAANSWEEKYSHCKNLFLLNEETGENAKMTKELSAHIILYAWLIN